MIPTPRSRIRTIATVSVLVSATALAACGGGGTDLDDICAAVVDLFPVPVDDTTSLFVGEVDDGFLEVDFAPGFDFAFYGDTYNSVFLNTNGGMTFGAGNDDYEEAAVDILEPSIATFWSDLNAGGVPDRANQMTYRVCEDRFIVQYNQLADYDDDTLHNSATVTLEESGKITVQYGTVETPDLLVGIFDGTHADDDSVAIGNTYTGYATGSTGKILLDYYDNGVANTGQLLNRTIVYTP